MLKTYGERGTKKMGKTCKLGNKKVIWALMILAIIVVSIIGYICINSDVITYAFIEQTQEQIEIYLQNRDGISWMASAYRWLCCGVSIVFLMIRLCRNIKLRNKSTEELIMSYPMGRKQIITREILILGYGIVLSVLAFFIAIAFMGMEAIKIHEISQNFELANVVMSYNQDTILWCMEKSSLLIFFIAWHYLCEVVCVERMVGFFLGAIGIAIYNIYFFGYDMEIVGYIEYGRGTGLFSVVTMVVILLLAMLLFRISIWLYQKVDFSKSGWFYFDLPKYFFIACICLLPISAATANMNDLELPSIGFIILILVLVVALNYLAVSNVQRKNVLKLFMESGKTIIVFCVLVFVVFNFEYIRAGIEGLYAEDEQWGTYEISENVDWIQDKYKGEQECKDALEQIQNKELEVLVPGEMEQWMLQEGSIEWMVYGTPSEFMYTGYYMRLENSTEEDVIVSCTRMEKKTQPVHMMSCIEGLKVIQDDKYGTLIVSSYEAEDERVFVSFNKYYEGKEYYDSYNVTGEVPEEELLTIIHSLK